VVEFPGGLLFEFFLSAFSRPHVHRRYVDLCDNADLDDSDDPILDPESYLELYEIEKVKFAAFVYARVCNLGTRTGHQTFMRTLYMKFKGLSNRGMATMAAFGWCMTSTTYKRHLTKNIRLIRSEIRYIDTKRISDY